MKSTITVTRSARHPETCHDVIIRAGESEGSISLSNIPRGFSLQGNIQSAIGEVLCTWADVAAAIGEFEKMAASVKGLSVRSVTLKVPGELEIPDTTVFERMAGEIREANDRPGKNTEVKIEASAGKQGTSAFVEVRQTDVPTPRTEAERSRQQEICGKPAVSVEFCRQLARELAEAKAEKDRQTASLIAILSGGDDTPPTGPHKSVPEMMARMKMQEASQAERLAGALKAWKAADDIACSVGDPKFKEWHYAMCEAEGLRDKELATWEEGRA